ncbi:MAG TPA: hypothetical protein DCS23_01125 [Candidatus Yonathbacteria bacterium]|nr:hypothetical protein [Candidatus Yonathbacteria bacterium]
MKSGDSKFANSTTSWVAKHKRHNHLALATLALVLAGTGAYIYRQEIAQAATYTFTQSSWAGGVTANDANHTSNQSNWTQYSATSTNITAVSDGVSLSAIMGTKVDDGAGLSTRTDYATGINPHGVAISADGTSVYVVNNNTGSNSVSMYSRNTSTGALSAKTDYATGVSPRSVTISADGASVYVTNSGSNTVSMYSRNTSTGALSAKTDYAAGGSTPRAITISADGASVYVTNNGSASVSVYARNTSTGAISSQTNYATGASPNGVIISPDGAFVYVTNYASASVYMYSRNTSTGALTVGGNYSTGTYPYGVTISADGASVYVANYGSASVSMYFRNTSTGALSAKTDYATGVNPRGVTISPDGAFVYVTNYNSSSVSMYSRNTSTGALSAKTDYATGGVNSFDVTVSTDGASVYVTNSGTNTVSMFSRVATAVGFESGTHSGTAQTGSVSSASVGLIATSDGTLSSKTDYVAGASPFAVTISADGTSVYVANTGSNSVSMYSRNTSTGALSAKTDYATGGSPRGVAISADGTSVYVANYGSASVSMYSRNTSTGTLSPKTDYATGASPYGVTISADGTSVYVANFASASVSRYSRNTSTGTLSPIIDYTTGGNPRGATISADGTSVYVANSGATSVSMYSRNTSSGILSAKTDYATGASPMAVTVSPDGTSVYVANNNSATVSMYSRNTVYTASGTFTSAVINTAGQSAFTTLSYTTTLNGQTITIDARAGNTATPDGSWTAWQTGIASGGSISGLAGNQYIQYRANLSTSNPAVTPLLDSVTVNYNQYSTSGNLTSSKYDSESAAGLISNVMWSATGTSGTEVAKFQVRSSPDGTTWTNWCGPSTACLGTDYFTTSTGEVGGITSGHPLLTGGDDRYVQYKAFLTSAGISTPTITSATIQYVVNAAPTVSNTTASQGSDGIVTVGYDVDDSDNSIGNIVDVTLQYCTTNCSTGTEVWADATAVSGNVGNDVALGTGKSILWAPFTDYASQYKSNTQKIRVKANDRDAANNLGYGTSATFTLDTTVPAITTATLDSSTGDTSVGTIALTTTDDSTIQYRLCNDSAFPSSDSQGNSCAWTTLAVSPISNSNIAWIPTGAPSNEAVYLQVRDLYGNVTAQTIVAPATLADFTYADASNTAGGVYREFLSWSPFVATTSSTFGSYKVYHSLDNFATAGTLLTTITNSATNYYVHNVTTATSSVQYYRVLAVNDEGNTSNYTAVLSDVPDGSGGIDVTAPYIPLAGIATPSIGNSSANITFSTYTNSSLAVGELATSTVFYGSYSGSVPSSCPSSSVDTDTYTVNHSIYLTGLSPDTTYYYCVVAKDMAGNTSAATTATGGIFETVGGPRITNVTEREITDLSALIFWNTSTSSDSKVYYATTKTGVNSATPTTGAVVTVEGSDGSYQHQVGLSGLTAGQIYYYKVTSTDTATPANTSTDNNNGQYYSFVTLKDTTPPTISGIATPVLSSESAVIIWQTNEPASTRVQWGTTSSYGRSTIPDETKSIYHIVTLSSGTLDMSSVSQELTAETAYHFRVRSDDMAGNITESEDQALLTTSSGNVTIVVVRSSSDPVTDTTAPSISNVVVSDITPFGAVVKFTTDENAVTQVEAGTTLSYGQTASNFDWGKDHTITLRGLTLGTEYHIRVKAVDKTGNTGTSADQTFKTTFLSENLKDMANIENIEAFQKEIESAIESILPSLVPPFITKPTITDITESGAKISFRSNIKAFPVVVYAEGGAFDETKENPYTGEVSDTTEKATSHELVLTGLKGNTKYHVQARAFSLPRVIGKSADVTFITKASKIAGSIVERKKDSFTVVWTTVEPTSSIVEFRDLKRGITGRKTNDAKKTTHSVKIENLPPGTAYEVNLSGVTEQGNIAEAGSPLSVTTSTDTTAPVISGFKVDNALVPGRTDRIQTIVSWVTDEPSNSTAYYQEGAGAPGETEELANKNEILDSYVTSHSIILPSLKPGTIYRLKVTSSDDSGNEGSFGPRTVITPKQTESITDIIFKNFEDSFKFLRKI